MKLVRTLAVATLLTLTQAGCATKIDLSNRISKTEACDEVHVTSKWTKWLGITTVVNEKDAEAMLKMCKADQQK